MSCFILEVEIEGGDGGHSRAEYEAWIQLSESSARKTIIIRRIDITDFELL